MGQISRKRMGQKSQKRVGQIQNNLKHHKIVWIKYYGSNYDEVLWVKY